MIYKLILGENSMEINDDGITFSISQINLVNLNTTFHFQVYEENYSQERVNKLQEIVKFLQTYNGADKILSISLFSEAIDDYMILFNEKFQVYEYNVKQLTPTAEQMSYSTASTGTLFQVLIHGIGE